MPPKRLGSGAFRTAVATALFAAMPIVTTAQTSGPGFLGFGGAYVIDRAPRLVLGGIEEGESSRAILIDGGVSIAPRVALGAEIIRPATIETSTSGRFGTVSKKEQELSLAGTVRVSILRNSRMSLDVSGGLGLVRATSETDSLIDNAPFPSVRSITSERTTAVAVVTGIDFVGLPVRHLAVGPLARIYWLRGDERPPSFPGETLPLANRSTARVVLGAIVRVY